MDQPAREENIAAIVGYYESGIKDRCDAVGIELEHILVHSDGSAVTYWSDPGQHQFLEALAPEYTQMQRNQHGDLIGLLRSGSSVTLEPGSQMELSAGPFIDLHEAKKDFLGFENRLKELAAPCGIDVLTLGYHPTCRVEQIRILPKKRYEYMDRYFRSISGFGTCMMRGSASTQVSIDYSSEADCLRKFRLANACVPIFSLICDNSPVFEAEPRSHFLMRTEIWEKCDPGRCMIVPGSMDDGFSLRQYAEYILDTPAIVSIVNGEEEYTTRTFGDIFADKPMNEHDVEHAISMFFNDVRLKKYIEIRPADAMPVEHVIAYAALIKGLFYSEQSLQAMEAVFSDVSEDDVRSAKNELMGRGYEAEVYGRPATDLAAELMQLAHNALQESDRVLLAPLERLVEGKVTLADLETP